MFKEKRTKVKEPSTALCKKVTSIATTDLRDDEILAQGKFGGNIDHGGRIDEQGLTKWEVWQIWREELLRRLKAGDKFCVWDDDTRGYYVFPKKLLEIGRSIHRNFNEDWRINEELRSLIHKECFKYFKNS